MVFKLAQWVPTTVSLFFIYLYLPLSLFVYYAMPARYRVGGLLGISLGFVCFVAPTQLPIILAVCFSSYLLLGQMYQLSPKALWQRRLLFAFCLGMNLLAWVTFSSATWGGGLPYLLGGAVVPLLAIDTAGAVYRGRLKEWVSFPQYLMYCLFLPRLYLGPIQSMEEFAGGGLSHRPAGKNLLEGGGQLLRGAFQITFFGVRLLGLGEQISRFFPGEITLLSAWAQVLVVGLGLFHLLGGLSQLAQGIGTLFGVTLPADTSYPLQAVNLEDFLKRFHRTLGGFYRRNLVRPLARLLPGRWMEALLIVASGGLMGLWFELSWGLLAAGTLLAAFYLGEKFWWKAPLAKLPGWAQRIYTLVLVAICFGVLVLGRSGWDDQLRRGLLFSGELERWNNQILYLISSNFLPIGLGLLLATDRVGKLLEWVYRIFPRVVGALQLGFHLALLFLLTALLS